MTVAPISPRKRRLFTALTALLACLIAGVAWEVALRVQYSRWRSVYDNTPVQLYPGETYANLLRPCLNPVPIPPARATDPHFLVNREESHPRNGNQWSPCGESSTQGHSSSLLPRPVSLV